MDPVRNHKLMKNMITRKVELTKLHRQPLMKKIFCF